MAVPVIALGGLFLPWLGFAVVAILLSLVMLSLLRGRYWCGNICPHGSLFDVATIKLSRMRPIPTFFRSPALKWAFFVFFMAMFAFRLYGAFGYRGDPLFVDRLGMVFVRQYLLWPTLVGLVLAFLVKPRTWCTFCPMGTMQEIVYRAGTRLGINSNTDVKLSWRDKARCIGCGKCSQVCPMQLSPHKQLGAQGQAFQQRCIRCSTCVVHCPTQALLLTSSGTASEEGLSSGHQGDTGALGGVPQHITRSAR